MTESVPPLNLYRDWLVQRQGNMVLVRIGSETTWFTPEQARQYASDIYVDTLDLADNVVDQAQNMLELLRHCATEAEST